MGFTGFPVQGFTRAKSYYRQNSYVETLGELIQVVGEIHFLAVIEPRSHFLAIGHS